MKTPKRSTQFKRDIKLAKKRGKDLSKIEKILSDLIDSKPLSPKHRDHPLKGEYKDRRECHIESDWLLIYKDEEDSIVFERTGTHSDLFE